jgi:hypothetical protein
MITYLREELPYLKTPLHTVTWNTYSWRSSQENFFYSTEIFCKPEIFTVKVYFTYKINVLFL